MKELLQQAVVGETAAREKLIAMVWESALRGLLDVVGPGEAREAIDDLLQDALIAFAAQLDRIDRNPHGYVYQIARNKALRYLKRKAAARKRYNDAATEDAIEQIPGETPRPADTLHCRLALAALTEGLPRILSQQELTLFTLLYVERKEKADILDEMGISDNHFRVVKHNIERKVRSHFQEWRPDISNG